MDKLEVVRLVMAQHKVIFSHLQITGDSMNDMEALLKLERARADLNLSVQKTLNEKSDEIEAIITPIDRGLRKHYAFEEDVLPPLLGPVLTEALFSEHKELLRQMEEMAELVKQENGELLTRDQALGKESLIYECLEKLRASKLDHLNREEAILLTLQNVMEFETA